MSAISQTGTDRRRVCLVGCGRIASVHARNLTGDADLCFCSRSISSAERMNDAHGGSGAYDSLEAALGSGIDAAVICSPPECHREQTTQLLQAGKSVLVEKPMCIADAEVDEIGRVLQEGTDGFLMVAENYYYKPSLALIRRILSEGHLGPLRRVELKKLSSQVAVGWKAGFGALLEGGIHFVALLSDIVDADPEQVRAEFPGLRLGEVERHAVLDVVYPGGVQAHLTYAWDTPSLTRGTFQHSRIVCENGQVVFESNGLYVLLRSGLRSRLYPPRLGDLMGYRAMTQDFVDCLADPSRRPYSDFHRARRDLGIVFDAYRHLPVAV
jgi:predicted dehydrogenase